MKHIHVDIAVHLASMSQDYAYWEPLPEDQLDGPDTYSREPTVQSAVICGALSTNLIQIEVA